MISRSANRPPGAKRGISGRVQAAHNSLPKTSPSREPQVSPGAPHPGSLTAVSLKGSNKRSSMGVSYPMKPMVTDELWEEIKPLLPPHPPRPRGGRAPSSDRAALEGILYVLRSGVPWELLPAVFGVCGMTCWRRLRDWQAAGVWERLHGRILNRLQKADKLDWRRACVDSTSVRATKGANEVGPSPTDRGKASTKHHLVVEGHGYPIAECISAGNVNDCQRARGSHRRHSASQRQTRASPQASAKTSRRQRLRSCQMQAGLEAARDHPEHRPPRDRIQGALGTLPLGR